MTGSQLWENLEGGTASAKVLRQSKLDMLIAEKEGGTSVSKRMVIKEAGETSKVSQYSQTHQQTKGRSFGSIP